MWLRKEQGGACITWQGAGYEWPRDGDVTEVPAELGAELLRIQGAGFTEATAPDSETASPARKPRGKRAQAAEPGSDEDDS